MSIVSYLKSIIHYNIYCFIVFNEYLNVEFKINFKKSNVKILCKNNNYLNLVQLN